MLNVNDLIICKTHQWRITGIFLGGLNQCSLIGVEQCNTSRLNPTAYGKTICECFIPEEFINALLQSGSAYHYKFIKHQAQPHGQERKDDDKSRD